MHMYRKVWRQLNIHDDGHQKKKTTRRLKILIDHLSTIARVFIFDIQSQLHVQKVNN